MLKTQASVSGRPSHRRGLVALLSGVVAVTAACGGDSGDTAGSASGGGGGTVRLALLTGEGHPYYAGAVAFKEKLEELTDGEITVELFADAQLGGEADYLELVSTGGLEFGEFVMGIPASSLGEDHLNGLALPFLYPDSEAMYEALDSDVVQEALAVLPEAHGFECVGLWDTGFRQLTSNKPIESVDDINGLRIRVPEGELYVQTWESLGAVPTPLAIPELYSALETGVVQATDIPFVAIDSLKYYEVQTHGAEINYSNDPTCFAASTQYMDSLSDELADAVREAGRASTEASRASAQDSAESSIEALKANGMIFTSPDVDELKEAVGPVYEGFFERTGDEGRALVEGIQDVVGG